LKAEEIVSEKALAIMIYARTRPDKREKGREGVGQETEMAKRHFDRWATGSGFNGFVGIMLIS